MTWRCNWLSSFFCLSCVMVFMCRPLCYNLPCGCGLHCYFATTARQRSRLLWPLFTMVRLEFWILNSGTGKHSCIFHWRGTEEVDCTDMRGQKSSQDLTGSRTTESGCVENTKLTLACLQESFMTMNRCSQLQWTLNPAWVGFWCRMISFPYLWIAVHLTVWCGNRDK